MNTLVTILTRPNQTFEYLEKKYEDISNPGYDLIYMLLGALAGLVSFLKDPQSYNNLFNIHPTISVIIAMLLGAGFSYVLVKYIIVPITYWIGKALKGQAEKEQISMVIAYSLIPAFFRIPFEIYYSLSENNTVTVIEYWMVTGVYYLIFIWTWKIEIQGLMFFNRFGLLKAIINKLPIFLISYGGVLYYLTVVSGKSI